MISIDLNCDVGELHGPDGVAIERQLLEIVTSANVACGGHAGDCDRMLLVARQCHRGRIAFGAHPGYDDRENFGRVDIDISHKDLVRSLTAQLTRAARAADDASTHVAHVKPHGALYNRATIDDGIATCIVQATQAVLPNASIMGLPGSRLIHIAAAAGLSVIREAFADRAYSADGTLVPRSQPGAVLTDRTAVAEQATRIACNRRVLPVDGHAIVVEADSLCLHSDTPDSVQLARAIRSALELAGVTLAPPRYHSIR